MSQLPLHLPPDQAFTRWKSILDPVIAAPMTGVQILSDISLINGVTVINHKLGQMQQGWFLVDINGAAAVYRSSPFNERTLTLTSNAAVTVSIGVF